MKKIIYILSVFTLMIFVNSCDKSNDDDDDSIGLNNFSDSIASAVVLRINKNLFSDTDSDRQNSISIGDTFVINSAKKEGDFLKVNLSYAGGCKQHSFEIIWNGIIYTDKPCFINLLITHNGNSDLCEAYITETIAINLKELIGDVEYKDKCGYNIFTSFNTSGTPDVFVQGSD